MARTYNPMMPCGLKDLRDHLRPSEFLAGLPIMAFRTMWVQSPDGTFEQKLNPRVVPSAVPLLPGFRVPAPVDPPTAVRCLRRARRRWRNAAQEEIRLCRASLEEALDAALEAEAASEPGPVASVASAVCSIVGCGRPAMRAEGICRACWIDAAAVDGEEAVVTFAESS